MIILNLASLLPERKKYHFQSIKVADKPKLAKIAEAGTAEKMKELGVAIEDYLRDVKDGHVKQRIREATLNAYLKMLSKYFINYKYTDLKALFNCSEDDIRQLGYTVKDGFIETKREEVHSDCLLTKLRELAIAAHRMNKFE